MECYARACWEASVTELEEARHLMLGMSFLPALGFAAAAFGDRAPCCRACGIPPRRVMASVTSR